MTKTNKIVYFPHDTNASNDPKIVHIKTKFGWSGVGMYWALIEALHKEPSGEIKACLVDSIILDLFEKDALKAEEFKNELYAIALLVLCNGNATSQRVKQNLTEINSKSDVGRANALKRWKNRANIKENKNDAIALQRQCKPNANKVNKSKVKLREPNSSYKMVKLFLEEMNLTRPDGDFKMDNLFPAQCIYRYIKETCQAEGSSEPNDDKVLTIFKGILEKMDTFHRKNATSLKYIKNNFNKIYKTLIWK